MADFSLLEIAGINGPTYETFYNEQKQNPSGDIVAQDAAPFLKKFGLSDFVLSQIWTLADTRQRGMLSKQEFFIALKLVALAQNDKEISLANVPMSSIPAPKLLVTNSPALPLRGSFLTTNARSIPCIPNDEILRYKSLFEQLHPIDGKLPGQQVKPTFVQYNLPMELLGKIWDLSDIDKDGALDEEEFILAMYLIRRSCEGEALPDSVPTHLINSSRKRSLLLTLTPTVAVPKPSTPVSMEWAVPPEERNMYEPLFYTADQDRDGFVSGLEIKDTFMKSGLSQPILAQIWTLCDTRTSGKLNCEQFALAMHLINQQLSSHPPELPSMLPWNLVPPSMRSADKSGPKPISLSDFGIPVESDRVFAEVEAIRKEREEVERACYQLELQNSQRANEVANAQRAVDQAKHTQQQLEQQKSEAESKLAEYHQRKDMMEQTLAELRKNIVEEKKQVETLRSELASQQSAMRNQEAEAGRLRGELSQLQREEATIQEKIQANQRRLQAIESENKQYALRVEEAQKSLGKLESYKKDLQNALEQLQNNEENVDSGVAEADVDFIKDLISRSPTVVSADGFSSSLDEDSLPSKVVVAPAFNATNLFQSTNAAPPANDPFFDSSSTAVQSHFNDPFASSAAVVVDPFGSGLDPFGGPAVTVKDNLKTSANNQPFEAFDDFFSSQQGFNDPFTSGGQFGDKVDGKEFTGFDADPFTAAAFSTSTTTTSKMNAVDSHFDDPFGNSSWATPSSALAPPPRPPKGPPTRGAPTADSFKAAFDPFTGPIASDTSGSTHSTNNRSKDKHSHRKGSATSQNVPTTTKPVSNSSNTMLSESDQLRWAKEESERIAKLEETARRKEEEELQLAIRLSQMDAAKKHGKKKK